MLGLVIFWRPIHHGPARNDSTLGCAVQPVGKGLKLIVFFLVVILRKINAAQISVKEVISKGPLAFSFLCKL